VDHHAATSPAASPMPTKRRRRPRRAAWPEALVRLAELNGALGPLAAAHGAVVADLHGRFLGHGRAVSDTSRRRGQRTGPPGVATPRPRSPTPATRRSLLSSSPAVQAVAPGRTADRAVIGSHIDRHGRWLPWPTCSPHDRHSGPTGLLELRRSALGWFWTPQRIRSGARETCEGEVCWSVVVSEGRHTDTLSSADRYISSRRLSDRVVTTL
jgi:hypothetical protein